MVSDAPNGLSWFAIGPNAWGKSQNAFKAFKNAVRNGGKGNYTLHLVNEDAEVDPVCGTLGYSEIAGVKVNFATVKAKGY